MDYQTKTDVEMFLSLMLAAVKVNIEQAGFLVPVAVVLVPGTDPEPIAADVPITEEAKNRWLEAIKRAIDASDPVGVFIASEAWKVSLENREELNKLVAETGGRLSDHPDRQEVVDVIFEHKTIGRWEWEANIIRGDGDSVKLTPFRQNEHKSPSGRFANLLKKAQS